MLVPVTLHELTHKDPVIEFYAWVNRIANHNTYPNCEQLGKDHLTVRACIVSNAQYISHTNKNNKAVAFHDRVLSKIRLISKLMNLHLSSNSVSPIDAEIILTMVADTIEEARWWTQTSSSTKTNHSLHFCNSF